MRVLQDDQLRLGEVSIADIKIDMKSRDDLPQLLRGLQYLYTNKAIREKLFTALGKLIPEKIDKKNGRPGMSLWRILVLGMLRLNLNWDYDRLQSMANDYKSIREMLGHPSWDDHYYELQTLKDNLRLFTPAILDEINQIVVTVGHELVKKKPMILD